MSPAARAQAALRGLSPASRAVYGDLLIFAVLEAVMAERVKMFMAIEAPTAEHASYWLTIPGLSFEWTKHGKQ